jgi:hypothetical protein
MKRTIASVSIAMVVAGTGVGIATYLVLVDRMNSRVLEVQAEVSTTKDELLGYTKYTDYVIAGRQVLTEQAKFLAAKVVRDYTLIEHLEVGRLGLTSNATVIVHYTVEYSFGYDLQPASFDLRATPAGLEIRIGRPILVAAPAVTPLSHEIPDRGLWTHEREAIIQIHQRLPAVAQARGLTMARENVIRAACEMRLVEFLRNFLGKQAGVRHVPSIAVVYEN